MTNCAERYSLNSAYCCVEQMLTEPFVVGNHNFHYRLRFGNVASLLLRHQTETVAGEQEDVHGTTTVPVYKPLFYFTIDPDNGRSLDQLHLLQIEYDHTFTDDCSSIPSITPTVTTESTTEGTTEGTTEDTTAGDNTHTITMSEVYMLKMGRWCLMHKVCVGNVTFIVFQMPVQSETLTGSKSHDVMPSSPAIPTEQSSGTTFSVVVGVSVPLVVLTITAFIIIISVTVCVRQRKRNRAAAENIALCSIGSQLKPTNENSPEEYDYVSTHRSHPLQTSPTTDTDSARRDVLTTSNQAYGVTQGGDGVTENVAYGVGRNDFTCDTGADAGEGEKYDYVTMNDVIITAARNEAYGVTGDVSLTSNDAYGLVA